MTHIASWVSNVVIFSFDVFINEYSFFSDFWSHLSFHDIINLRFNIIANYFCKVAT